MSRHQPARRPDRAMVLAAGLGTRMRPISNSVPKPLVPIAGRTLIDRQLDRLEEGGVEAVVVNLHHLADQIERHLSVRPRPKVTFVHEPQRLETGGGVVNALPHLDGRPFFVANSDVVVLNGPRPVIDVLADAWDDETMDGVLLLHPTPDAHGYAGEGDFLMDPSGRLTRRPERTVAPYLFTGIQLLHPRLFDGLAVEPFSLNRVYDLAMQRDRLYGVLHDGEWFHVGTPDDIAIVERYLNVQHGGSRRT
jgi:MurNAc alpha-1-phosphate uridylyltransferase